MGNYSIVIEGLGSHGGESPHTAEAIAQRCVRDLTAAGHSVLHATVHANQRTELKVERGEHSFGVVTRSDGHASMPVEDGAARAERLYNAYCGKAGWKSAVSGQPLPGWSATTDAVRECWMAVADAAAR